MRSFREFANNIALHIGAANPEYITIDDIPADILDGEKELAKKTIDGNKPAEILEKIVEGKLSKFYEEKVLLKQKYIKDDSKTVEDLLNDTVAAIGEKIEIGKFCRMQINAPACARGI